ncbi:hypothetical protein B0H11DRAFT_2245104 [Mycena galericulata]|nr:hypothetical protein B0H11DRAFT_2245104 [Mycena galericulata]
MWVCLAGVSTTNPRNSLPTTSLQVKQGVVVSPASGACRRGFGRCVLGIECVAACTVVPKRRCDPGFGGMAARGLGRCVLDIECVAASTVVPKRLTPSNAPTAARASPLDAREAIQEFSSPSPSPSSSMIRRVNKPPVHPPSTPVRRFKTWARVAVAVALLLARYAELDKQRGHPPSTPPPVHPPSTPVRRFKTWARVAVAVALLLARYADLDKVSVFVFIFTSVTPSNAPTAARASPLDAREAIQEFSSPSPSPSSSMIRRVNKPPVHPPSTPVRRFKTWARVAVAVALLLARYAELDKQRGHPPSTPPPVHPPSTPVRRFKTWARVAVAVALLLARYADLDKVSVFVFIFTSVTPSNAPTAARASPLDAREAIQEFSSPSPSPSSSMIRRVNKPPVHPPSTPVRRFKTWARVAVAVALLLARYAELDKQRGHPPSTPPPVHPPSTPVRRFKTWARVAVAVALLLARYADLDKLRVHPFSPPAPRFKTPELVDVAQPVHPPSTPVRRFKTSEPVAVAVAFLFRWYADFDKQPVHPPPDAREVIQDFGSRRRRRRIALSMIRRVNKQPVHPPSTPVRRFKTFEPVAVVAAFLFR